MDAKKILYNIVYIPIMKRWGDDEHGHHYLLGAYDKLETAILIAEQEREDRAGKYEYVIEAYELNIQRGHSKSGIYRPARSKEMNCLTDEERDIVVNDKKQFEIFYKKKTEAMLKSDIESTEKEIKDLERSLQNQKNRLVALKEKVK